MMLLTSLGVGINNIELQLVFISMLGSVDDDPVLFVYGS